MRTTHSSMRAANAPRIHWFATSSIVLASVLSSAACDRSANSTASTKAVVEEETSDAALAQSSPESALAIQIAPPAGYDLSTPKPKEVQSKAATLPLPEPPPRAKNAPKVDAPTELLTTFEGVSVEREWLKYPDGSPKKIAYHRQNADLRIVDHGPDWRWYETGQIWIQRTWRDGKQDGPFAEWHQSGCEKQRGNYVADERDGHWLSWYETAMPSFDREWKVGKLNGKSREWYPNGKLKVDSTWKEGQQDGPWRVFWPTGHPSQIGEYANGARIGPWQEWAQSGALSAQGSYVDGHENGAWLRIDAESQRIEESYALGVLDGPRRVFDAENHPLSEGNYARGKAHGLQIEWYPGAGKKSLIVYDNGVQSGALTYYFPDGQVQMQGTMKQGKRDGVWTFAKADGTRDTERSGTYRDDKKVAD